MNELPPDISDASACERNAPSRSEEAMKPQMQSTRIGSMTERPTAPRGA